MSKYEAAIADAMIWEFERLKEFGILMRLVGDRVTLRFRGSVVLIASDGASIEAALRGL